jgi:hypothetical protein
VRIRLIGIDAPGTSPGERATRQARDLRRDTAVINNLVNWFKRLCLPAEYHSMTLGSLRRQVLMVPGEFVRASQVPILRLPSSYVAKVYRFREVVKGYDDYRQHPQIAPAQVFLAAFWLWVFQWRSLHQLERRMGEETWGGTRSWCRGRLGVSIRWPMG